MSARTLSGWRLRWLAMLGVSLGAAYACSEYDSSLLVPGESGGTGGVNDAGNDTSSGGAAPDETPFWPHEAANGCDTEGVPTADQRPTTPDADDTDPLYLGMITMGFGSAKDDAARTPDPEARKTVGFDLDGSCTNSPTCTGQTEVVACKNSSGPQEDGELCRDNAFGGVISKMAEIPELVPYGYTEAHWDCGLLHGEFMQIFKITRYNGTLNDPQVRVDLYSSDGAEGLAHDICGSTGATLPSDWYNNAEWLKFDPFRVSSRYLTQQTGFDKGTLPESIYADANAYVRNGYLIVQLPDPFEFWLKGDRSYGHTAGIRLLIHRGVIAAKLDFSFQTENWTISEGTIGGVIKPSEFLANLREVGVCGNLCGADQPLIDYVNQHADSLVAGDPNPDTECDGLSLGMKFTAKELLPGIIVDAPDPTECTKVPTDAPPLDCGCPCIPMGGAGGAGGAAGGAGTGGAGGTTGGTGGTSGGAAGAAGSN